MDVQSSKINRPSRTALAARRVAVTAVAALALAAAPAALAQGTLPDPCQAVPSADIAAAFGVVTAPTGLLTTVLSTETCSFTHKGIVITVFVGLNSIGSPGTAMTAIKVPNLPTGVYATFVNSKETQVTFLKGPAGTGIYGIIRSSNAKITRAHLQTIARDLYASI